MIAIIAVSCQNDTNSESDIPADGEMPAANEAPIGADGAPAAIDSENPFTIDPSTPINAQPAATGAAATGGTAPGMNPPHGQPGHRCDIPDGAPLDSPVPDPAANATPIELSPSGQPTTVQPGANSIMTAPSGPTTQPATLPTSGSTPAGMNPPHGEPGHDCSVAVGAPLNK